MGESITRSWRPQILRMGIRTISSRIASMSVHACIPGMAHSGLNAPDG